MRPDNSRWARLRLVYRLVRLRKCGLFHKSEPEPEQRLQPETRAEWLGTDEGSPMLTAVLVFRATERPVRTERTTVTARIAGTSASTGSRDAPWR